MGEITDALRRSRPRDADAYDVPAHAEPLPCGPLEDPGTATACVEIPRTGTPPWVARAVIVSEQEAVAESFRHFALQVRPVVEGLRNRAILITSALRLEGKTTTASNLALALASLAAERRIALVDLDTRRPSIAKGLGIRPAVGIDRVLTGEATLAAARIRTDVPALDIFAVEEPRKRAHEILAGHRLPRMLQELRAGYDTVVIDGPPVLLVPDALLILPHVGACVVVARSGVTTRSAFREMLSRLPKDRLIGSFLNDAPVPRHARRYGYEYAADHEAGAPD